jgi:hypothetical protein
VEIGSIDFQDVGESQSVFCGGFSPHRHFLGPAPQAVKRICSKSYESTSTPRRRLTNWTWEGATVIELVGKVAELFLSQPLCLLSLNLRRGLESGGHRLTIVECWRTFPERQIRSDRRRDWLSLFNSRQVDRIRHSSGPTTLLGVYRHY